MAIVEQRIQLAEHLNDNPSLENALLDAFTTAYRLALVGAQKETDLPEAAFPAACPWTIAQIIDDGFMPN